MRYIFLLLMGLPILTIAQRGDTHYLRRKLKKSNKKSGGDGGGSSTTTGPGFDTAQHNPNGFANLTCHDWVGFEDSEGYSCEDYSIPKNGNWCGLIANQRQSSHGFDANWACCQCGGGIYDDPGSTILEPGSTTTSSFQNNGP